ncbi:hypothetical protein FBU59_004190, partial [Linderina macrospora]
MSLTALNSPALHEPAVSQLSFEIVIRLANSSIPPLSVYTPVSFNSVRMETNSISDKTLVDTAITGTEVNGHKGIETRVSNPTKDAWILQSLRKRRSEFLSTSTIQAFIGTWNVNGQAAASASELSEWLGFVPAAGAPVVVSELPELL